MGPRIPWVEFGGYLLVTLLVLGALAWAVWPK